VLPVLILVVRGDAANVAGFAVLGVLSTAYITHAGGLVSAREGGVLKRWRATPLPRWCWFAGRIGATVLVAVAGGAVTVLVGVSSYGLRVDASAALSLAVALILGAAAWACIGTAASAFIPTPRLPGHCSARRICPSCCSRAVSARSPGNRRGSLP
jgi:ABC-2 type transport system permease protein